MQRDLPIFYHKRLIREWRALKSVTIILTFFLDVTLWSSVNLYQGWEGICYVSLADRPSA